MPQPGVSRTEDFVRDVISFGGGLYVIEEIVDTVDHRLVWVPGDSEAAALDEESLACRGLDLAPNLVRAQRVVRAFTAAVRAAGVVGAFTLLHVIISLLSRSGVD
jgi:hypothetical protein